MSIRVIDLQQTSDFLEESKIADTIDAGHAIIHIGKDAVGNRFVLVNNMHGESALTIA